MKKLKSKYSLGAIASLIFAMVAMYSCTSDNTNDNSENESLAFEKQLIVTDESGDNSITLKVSSDNETSLINYTIDNYELVINPEIPEETNSEEFQLDFEDSEPIEYQYDTNQIHPAVKIAVVSVDFKDPVHSYSLVSNVSPEVNDEENLKGINLCLWHPRDYQYVQIDNYGATRIKTTFGRTKNTCNNIEYHIFTYGSVSSPFKSYQLKHPGDEVTTYAVGQGMTVLYKYKKNAVVTYTWYY
ncbi:hypothetical protein [Flavobacterium sp.]|uniref:hypothetical protein n=1 Tax=Flavobacterium sp. TaxID=239 RepID=UPI004047B244